ncbi:MAG: sigma-70 family RNA polymerase sigma factor [Planctomycetota bacterium]
MSVSQSVRSDRRADGTGKMTPDQERRFLRLVAGCMDDLRRVVVGFVGHADDADDVLQETLLKLYDGFDGYDPDRSFRAWACTIGSNAARDFLRRRKLRRGFGFDDDVLSKLASVRTATHELTELRNEKFRECLGGLPTKDQEMVWGCYGRDERIKDWAAERGLPASTVGSRLRKIREALLACVNRKMGAFQ